MVRSIVFWLHVLERIANTVDEENYGAPCLDTVVSYPNHLHHAWNAFRHVDSKNYGARLLDTVIAYPDHLDHAWNTEVQNTTEHATYFMFGHSEHLDHTLATFRHIGTKTTERTTETPSSATIYDANQPFICMKKSLFTFQNLFANRKDYSVMK